MSNIEQRPKPTKFDITKINTAQMLVDQSSIGAYACKKLMQPETEGEPRKAAFIYIFVIQPNRRVLVTTQGGTVAPTRKTTRSMDDAMDLWRSLEESGWLKLSADFWYEKDGPRGSCLGIVQNSTANGFKSLIGIEGKVCDLGYGFCVLSYRQVPINPSFHIRRRKIVTII